MSIWEVSGPSANYEAEQAAREAIFNKIVPAGNWKAPIKCWVKAEEFAECSKAAVWFTGAPLTVVATSFNMVEVEGPGYYAAVGA